MALKPVFWSKHYVIGHANPLLTIPMAYLETTAGLSHQRTIQLSMKRCTLGRQPDCDVVVDADSVSRRHARIILVGRDYYVEDLNSSNGTVVNNRVIQSRVRLQEGDCIRLSQFEFLFHDQFATPEQPVGEYTLPDQRSIIDEDDGGFGTSDTGTYLKLAGRDTSETGTYSSVRDPRFDALLEVTQSLGHFLSLDKLLPQILDSLFKMLPQAERGCIILKDTSGQLNPGWVKVRHGELRVSRAVVNSVMESGNAVVTSNASTDSRFSSSQSVADFRLKSVMCAPLVDREGEVLGVLQLDTSNGRGAFGEEDLRVLVAMATQASLAITIATLHESELRARTLERDLMLAAEVQRNSLPEDRPVIHGYEFEDYYEPAEKVGGDFYDYIPLPDGKMGIVIGDVVGHGVPAALVMSKILAEASFLTVSLKEPAAVLAGLNDITCRSTRLGRFITLLMMVLDPIRHQVTLASAGHHPPIVRRANGAIELPGRDSFGPPLGTAKETIYRSHTFRLERGEVVLAYTDGVTEANNVNAIEFGNSRLEQLVALRGTPAQIVKGVVDELDSFVGKELPQDDICMVCLGRD